MRIDKEVIAKIEIKHSKFIGILLPIDTKEELKPQLQKIKEQYPGATHYCYAYIIGQEKGFSDDKEPSKTAGFPILNLLEKKKLNHILAIAVRYFGGIKLGANGLIRAYQNCIQTCLSTASLYEVEDGYRILLSAPYAKENELNKISRPYEIIKKNYQNEIQYEVLIPITDIQKLKTSPYFMKILEKKEVKKKESLY